MNQTAPVSKSNEIGIDFSKLMIEILLRKGNPLEINENNVMAVFSFKAQYSMIHKI